ncbi:MAG: hypothetical protein AAGA58_08225 [Verrucomicrobiota bacterium]
MKTPAPKYLTLLKAALPIMDRLVAFLLQFVTTELSQALSRDIWLKKRIGHIVSRWISEIADKVNLSLGGHSLEPDNSSIDWKLVSLGCALNESETPYGEEVAKFLSLLVSTARDKSRYFFDIKPENTAAESLRNYIDAELLGFLTLYPDESIDLMARTLNMGNRIEWAILGNDENRLEVIYPRFFQPLMNYVSSRWPSNRHWDGGDAVQELVDEIRRKGFSIVSDAPPPKKQHLFKHCHWKAWKLRKRNERHNHVSIDDEGFNLVERLGYTQSHEKRYQHELGFLRQWVRKNLTPRMQTTLSVERRTGEGKLPPRKILQEMTDKELAVFTKHSREEVETDSLLNEKVRDYIADARNARNSKIVKAFGSFENFIRNAPDDFKF